MQGFAVGDAFGVPFEFKGRDDFQVPSVMIGEGTHFQPAGTWSDDTSLSLATVTALATGSSLQDVMDEYAAYLEEAAFTPYRDVFDVGIGTRKAITHYQETGEFGDFEASNLMNNGNGGVMRVWPVAFYEVPAQMTIEGVVDDLVGLTHGPIRSKIVARFFIYVLRIMPRMAERFESALEAALNRLNSDDEVQQQLAQEDLGWLQTGEGHSAVDLILQMKTWTREEIPSTGYVVDTLKAVLWVLLHTNTYEEAVETAVGLGNDTDTIAALTGAIAVFMYPNMPQSWVDDLAAKQVIEQSLRYADVSGKFS
jgi:ADP-ribosylglycohydrolase